MSQQKLWRSLREELQMAKPDLITVQQPIVIFSTAGFGWCGQGFRTIFMSVAAKCGLQTKMVHGVVVMDNPTDEFVQDLATSITKAGYNPFSVVGIR